MRRATAAPAPAAATTPARRRHDFPSRENEHPPESDDRQGKAALPCQWRQESQQRHREQRRRSGSLAGAHHGTKAEEHEHDRGDVEQAGDPHVGLVASGVEEGQRSGAAGKPGIARFAGEARGEATR